VGWVVRPDASLLTLIYQQHCQAWGKRTIPSITEDAFASDMLGWFHFCAPDFKDHPIPRPN
jgi:hypothetical protein